MSAVQGEPQLGTGVGGGDQSRQGPGDQGQECSRCGGNHSVEECRIPPGMFRCRICGRGHATRNHERHARERGNGRRPARGRGGYSRGAPSLHIHGINNPRSARALGEYLGSSIYGYTRGHGARQQRQSYREQQQRRQQEDPNRQLQEQVDQLQLLVDQQQQRLQQQQQQLEQQLQLFEQRPPPGPNQDGNGGQMEQ